MKGPVIVVATVWEFQSSCYIWGQHGVVRKHWVDKGAGEVSGIYSCDWNKRLELDKTDCITVTYSCCSHYSHIRIHLAIPVSRLLNVNVKMIISLYLVRIYYSFCYFCITFIFFFFCINPQINNEIIHLKKFQPIIDYHII